MHFAHCGRMYLPRTQQTNAFAAARVTRRRCGLLSDYFGHLLSALLMTIEWIKLVPCIPNHDRPDHGDSAYKDYWAFSKTTAKDCQFVVNNNRPHIQQRLIYFVGTTLELRRANWPFCQLCVSY